MNKVLAFIKNVCLLTLSVLFSYEFALAQDRGFLHTEDYPFFDRTAINDCIEKADGSLIVVGDDGLVAWTSDLGDSWQKTCLSRGVDLKSVQISADGTIWAVSKDNTIFRNLGDNQQWQTIYRDTSTNQSVLYAFVTKDIIIQTITNKSDGKTNLYKSVDAGVSWGKAVNLETFYPREIVFMDTAQAITWQYGTSYKTSTDGGLVWKTKNTSFYCNGCSVFNFDNFIIWGADSSLITSDAGASWNKLVYDSHSSFKKLFFIDSLTILGISYDAKLVISNDRGVSWHEIILKEIYSSYANVKIGNNHKFIYISDASKRHTFSTNNGSTWYYSLNNNIYNEYSLSNVGFSILNKDYAWALTQKGLIRTSNGGQSWKFLSSINAFIPYFSYYFPDIKFADVNTGYCVPKNDTLLKTTDGGDSWSIINPKNTGLVFHNLCFVDASTGWMIGSSQIMRTIDGGNIWSTQLHAGANIGFMQFLNNQTGWACGKKFYRTNNSGATWDSLDFDFSKFQFISSQIGFAYDANKRIYRTIDGGTNWTPQNQIKNCKSINNIHFVDSLCGMVATCSSFYFSKNADLLFVTDDGGKTFRQYNYDLVHSIYSSDKECYWLFGYNFIKKFYPYKRPYNLPGILFPTNGDTAFAAKFGIVNPNDDLCTTRLKIQQIGAQTADSTVVDFAELNRTVIYSGASLVNNSQYYTTAYTFGEKGRSDNTEYNFFYYTQRFPGVTKLITPIYNYVVENDTEEFTWSRNPYAESYTFKLYSDINRKKIVFTQDLSDTVIIINTAQYVGQYSSLYWAVQASNEYGRGDYSEVRILNFDMSSGVGSLPDDLSIYPNPVNDMIFLKTTQNFIIEEIEISDVNGRIVYKSSCNISDNYSIDCSRFVPGAYHIVLRTNNGKYYTKIVKQ